MKRFGARLLASLWCVVVACSKTPEDLSDRSGTTPRLLSQSSTLRAGSLALIVVEEVVSKVKDRADLSSEATDRIRRGATEAVEEAKKAANGSSALQLTAKDGFEDSLALFLPPLARGAMKGLGAAIADSSRSDQSGQDVPKHRISPALVSLSSSIGESLENRTGPLGEKGPASLLEAVVKELISAGSESFGSSIEDQGNGLGLVLSSVLGSLERTGLMENDNSTEIVSAIIQGAVSSAQQLAGQGDQQLSRLNSLLDNLSYSASNAIKATSIDPALKIKLQEGILQATVTSVATFSIGEQQITPSNLALLLEPIFHGAIKGISEHTGVNQVEVTSTTIAGMVHGAFTALKSLSLPLSESPKLITTIASSAIANASALTMQPGDLAHYVAAISNKTASVFNAFGFTPQQVDARAVLMAEVAVASLAALKRGGRDTAEVSPLQDDIVFALFSTAGVDGFSPEQLQNMSATFKQKVSSLFASTSSIDFPFVQKDWDRFTDEGVQGATASTAAANNIINKRPSAHAGGDQTVAENTTVTLDGRSSFDPEKAPLTYKWEQINGKTVTLSASDKDKVSFVAPNLASDGVVIFRLTVSDGTYSDNDAVIVVVTAKDDPPTAHAGSDTTLGYHQSITLDGSSSRDPEGNTLVYHWEQISGNSLEINDPVAAKTSIKNDQLLGGVFKFRLTVNDGTSQASSTVSFTRTGFLVPPCLTAPLCPISSASEQPIVATNESGDAIVVWTQEYESTLSAVFKSHYRQGVWTHPTEFSHKVSPTGESVSAPASVAMDKLGNIILVWAQKVGTNTQIFKAEYRNGQWSLPSSTSDYLSLSASSASDPQVAMDNNGNAIVVWSGTNGSNFQVFKSEYRNGTWTHPANVNDNISPDGADATVPKVSMDNKGNALIAWRAEYGGYMQLFKSDYRNGSWTNPSSLSDNISPDGQAVSNHSLAISDTGSALIVWEQSDGSKKQIFKSEYSNGVWTHPVSLSDNISPDGKEATSAKTCMNPQGEALIVWRQYISDTKVRLMKSEYRSGNWVHPGSLSDIISMAEDASNVTRVRCAMDKLGNAAILWEQTDGISNRNYLGEYRQDKGAWVFPNSVKDSFSGSGLKISDSEFAMDNRGGGIVIWKY